MPNPGDEHAAGDPVPFTGRCVPEERTPRTLREWAVVVQNPDIPSLVIAEQIRRHASAWEADRTRLRAFHNAITIAIVALAAGERADETRVMLGAALAAEEGEP
jgi:hypothetical protein